MGVDCSRSANDLPNVVPDTVVEYPPEFDGRVEHVIFVVGGIGGGYHAGGGSLSNAQRLQLALGAAGDDLGLNGQSVHIIEIGWSQDLHADLSPALSAISPQSEDELWARKIMNKVLADVLFFVCAHGVSIIQAVASKIIDRWKAFVAHRCGGDSAAAPPVSIIAHSLGSVIMYDILAHQRRLTVGRATMDADDDGGSVYSDRNSVLGEVTGGVTARLRGFLTAAAEAGGVVVGRRPEAFTPDTIPVLDAHRIRSWPQLPFNVDAFIVAGSPLGLFLLARGHATVLPRGTPPLTLPLPTVKRVYNIVNPLDPVAFRLEPLLNRRRQPCVQLGAAAQHTGSRYAHSFRSSYAPDGSRRGSQFAGGGDFHRSRSGGPPRARRPSRDGRAPSADPATGEHSPGGGFGGVNRHQGVNGDPCRNEEGGADRADVDDGDVLFFHPELDGPTVAADLVGDTPSYSRHRRSQSAHMQTSTWTARPSKRGVADEVGDLDASGESKGVPPQVGVPTHPTAVLGRPPQPPPPSALSQRRSASQSGVRSTSPKASGVGQGGRRGVAAGSHSPDGGVVVPLLLTAGAAGRRASIDSLLGRGMSRGGAESRTRASSVESAKTVRTRLGRIVDGEGERVRRVDFEVPVSGWMQGIAALRSHSSYFENPHVARFLLMIVHPEAKAIRPPGRAGVPPSAPQGRAFGCW